MDNRDNENSITIIVSLKEEKNDENAVFSPDNYYPDVSWWENASFPDVLWEERVQEYLL